MKKQALVTVLLLVLAAGCNTSREAAMSNAGSEFEKFCYQNSHQWMKMMPMNAGMITGQACYGCMPTDDTHICEFDDYKNYLLK